MPLLTSVVPRRKRSGNEASFAQRYGYRRQTPCCPVSGLGEERRRRLQPRQDEGADEEGVSGRGRNDHLSRALPHQLSESDTKRLAEERGGASFQELSAAAKEMGIVVVYGYPEVDRSSGESRYYNSAQLIDKDGRSLLNHHKVHRWLVGEDQTEAVFTPGNHFNVAECCGLRIGLLICYDVEFPEAVRALAVKGAQFIAVPTAVSSGYGFRTIVEHIIPTRALENRVYVAYTNAADGNFVGQSVCCDPNGEVVVKVGGRSETMLLASIDTNIEVQWSYLDDRRTSVYKDLV